MPVSAAQLLAAHLRGVDAVEQDLARVDLVEPHQQVDQGGLAGAGRPDDRDRLARLDGQRHVLDQRPVRRVAERHVVELDPAADSGRPGWLGRVGLLLGGVQQREHPLGRRDARLQQVGHAGNLGQRLAELP